MGGMTPLSESIDEQIAQCLLRDRPRLRRWWRRLGDAAGRDAAFMAALRGSVAIKAGRETGAAPSFPEQLPVTARLAEIGDLLRRHQVVVLCGETGSGKSTQLPKSASTLGRGVFGRIGHTQPRRIAARSLAARIAAELGGGRPERRLQGAFSRPRRRCATAVKLMTDGILLAEIRHDRTCSSTTP
jgi:ATP-dependent helicase HrpA